VIAPTFRVPSCFGSGVRWIGRALNGTWAVLCCDTADFDKDRSHASFEMDRIMTWLLLSLLFNSSRAAIAVGRTHGVRLFWVAIAIPNMAALADEPFLDSIDVFPPGTQSVARYRIPGVIVTDRGTVLAYCEARRNSSSDWGEIEVHLRRSLDGGRTWEPSQHIAYQGPRIEVTSRTQPDGAPTQTVNNPVAIFDRQTNAIELLFCINYARCFSIRSLDEGKSWSPPVEITAVFEPFRKDYDWKVIATGPGHGIQLQSGRLVVPIWLAFGGIGDHAPSAAGTIFSDDHGRSWQAGDIAFPNHGDWKNPNETTLTELSDGRVMLIARNESRPNRKLLAFSHDGASGWSQPEFHEQLWEPICMASVVSFPLVPRTLLFSNPHQRALDANGREIPGGRGKRSHLSIQLSRDDGHSWPILKTLDAGPSAYSDLAVLADGTVLCLYESQQSIRCARFNMEWLTTP
jgi:sialidase-1